MYCIRACFQAVTSRRLYGSSDNVAAFLLYLITAFKNYFMTKKHSPCQGGYHLCKDFMENESCAVS